MGSLYIMQAQPNPPGKDTVRPGYATADQLNAEWIEFEAIGGDRSLIGDKVLNLTFSHACQVTGEQAVIEFGALTLPNGTRLRLHTGPGTNQWLGSVLHVYAGRRWFVWNNGCGDRATIRYQTTNIDSAGYAPSPPEGVLVRIPGTDRLEPQRLAAYRF